MNKKVRGIIFSMFFMSLLANLGHPVTPELVVSLNMSSFMYGLMFASMSLANFLMSTIWGNLSDKYRTRKLFLTYPLFGYALAQIGFGYSTTSWSILFFRALAGASASAPFVVSTAYIIDETDDEHRSKAIALMTAVTGFSMSIGYLIGGYVGRNDYHYAFILQGVGLTIYAILNILFLKDSDVKAKTIPEKKKLSPAEIKELAYRYLKSAMGLLLLIVLLTSFSRIAYTTGINYYLKKHLSLTPVHIGYYMAFTGFVGMIANVYITPRISRRFGDNPSLLVVLITTGVTLLVLSTIKDLLSPIALVVFVIFIFVLSMYRPLLSTIISRLSKNEHGRVMGLQASFNSIGMVGGSLFAGALLDIYPMLTFRAAGIVFIVAFLLMIVSNYHFKKGNI